MKPRNRNIHAINATQLDDCIESDELLVFRKASLEDVLKKLGPISKEEVEYYENL